MLQEEDATGGGDSGEGLEDAPSGVETQGWRGGFRCRMKIRFQGDEDAP